MITTLTINNVDRTFESKLAEKIDNVIRKPHVLDYFTGTTARTVVGNRLAIRLILLVCAQRGLKNGSGVYLEINGGSGDGKSYTVRQTLWLLPEELVEDSSMTARAIFNENVTEPKIYYIDDFNSQNDDIKATLKSILTNFRRNTKHKVSEKIGGGYITVTKYVPARTIIIFSAVDSIGDVQIMNRLIPLPVEADDSIKRLQHDYQNDVASGRLSDLDGVADERVTICREVFRILTDRPVEVLVPYASEIIWPEKEFKNTRNYNVFLDLIKLCTVFEQYNRQLDEQGRLLATYDDFVTAVEIYSPRREMQTTKLSEGPNRLLKFLMINYKEDYTAAELVERLKVSQATIYRWLEILKEMSSVVEDKGARQVDTGDVDSFTGKHVFKVTTPNVYRYAGDMLKTNLFDSPIQLSDRERKKPEYKAWMETLQQWRQPVK